MSEQEDASLSAGQLKAIDNETFRSLRGVDCFQDFEGHRAAISFTGGKDCHLALQRARENGLEIVCGAMFRSPNQTFEAHRMEWQRAQGSAMGIPIVDCCLTTELDKSDPNYYKSAYAGAIKRLQEDYNVSVIVTGDIDFVFTSTDNFMQHVVTHYDCNGVKVLLPLWQQSRKDLLLEMIEKHDFDIRYCCVKTPHFDGTWIGRRIDHEAIKEMEAKQADGLDITGENGEFHTMVVNGPMYKDSPLQFVGAKPHELQDHWGRTKGERWWVISKHAKLVAREK